MRDCWHHIEKKLGDQYPPLHSACCNTIRDAKDIHCVCDRFTAHELTLLSLAKFAMATHVCGNGLHTDTHCAGWYIVIFVHTHTHILFSACVNICAHFIIIAYVHHHDAKNANFAGYLVSVMKVRPPPPGKHLGLQCKNIPIMGIIE